MRLPSTSAYIGMVAALLLSGASDTVLCGPRVPDSFDRPGTVTTEVVWLESASNPKAVEFDEPAHALDLAPATFPQVARMAHIEGTVEVEGTIGVDGRVVNAQVVDRIHSLVDDSSLEAFQLSLFRPAMRAGRPVPSAVRVAYTFSVESIPYIPPPPFPDDAELERRAGGQLPKELVGFIASADTFEVFEVCYRGSGKNRESTRTSPTRGIDFHFSDDRLFKYVVICDGIPLNSQQVGEFKRLVLESSPYWVPGPEDYDLFFSGGVFGYTYGVRVANSESEVFVMLGYSKAGSIVFGSESHFYGRGHPYKRSRDFFCELVTSCFGRNCDRMVW